MIWNQFPACLGLGESAILAGVKDQLDGDKRLLWMYMYEVGWYHDAHQLGLLQDVFEIR